VRPAGVLQRFRGLVAEDARHVDAHPELRLRTELTRFVHVAARQWYADLPLSSAMDSLWTTAGYLYDPTQLRTETDFESRSVDCLQQLRRAVEEFTSRHPDATPIEVDDSLLGPFVHVPPTVLLGGEGPDSHFDLICWNAANSLLEGIRRPYWAAQPVVHAGYHRPADVYGLLPALAPLTERYEDYPDEREETAEEIAAVLTRFLDVAPWPLD
jgi:hypothetical protein